MHQIYKVFIVNGHTGYLNWLPQVEKAKEIKDCDFVLFTGGEDVDPSIYNQPKHPKTSSNINRDRIEVKLYRLALRLKKPIVGICRGLSL